MTTLAALLLDLPPPRTVENARAWLEEQVTVPDDTPVTSRGVMARLSVADATVVFATLKAASASNALVAEGLEMLRLSGLDFSHPNMRAMVDALFPSDLAERVKALGEKTVPRWQTADNIGRLKDGYIEEAL